MLRIPKGRAPWLTARLLVFSGLAGGVTKKGSAFRVQSSGKVHPCAWIFLNPEPYKPEFSPDMPGEMNNPAKTGRHGETAFSFGR
jgi:hypothetical protein